ncbi:MAG: hypothetical protein ACREKL_16365, partial [Chthoniobacterales bacterium]
PNTCFTTKDAPIAVSASTLNAPEGIAYSSDGTLWVADTGNHRVLGFSNAATKGNGAAANIVLGQTTLTAHKDENAQPTSAKSLLSPKNLAVDESAGTISLWVADQGHRRVVRFDDVGSGDASSNPAALVLGQASFDSYTYGTTASQMYSPYAIAVDPVNVSDSPRTIWITDFDNNRVLRFSAGNVGITNAAPPVVIAKSSYKTRKKSLRIAGAASAGVPIARVTANRRVVGAAKWSFTATRLKVGKNRFTIIAYDVLGRSSPPKRINVKRTR